VERESVASYVDDFAARGSEVAYEHRRGLRPVQWTYARVASVARRFARELEARGIGHGDRVVLWGENCPEWVAAFYGCALRGAVAVPLDEQSMADFAARVVEQVAPKLVVLDRDGDDGSWRGVPALALTSLEEAVAGRDDAPVPSSGVTREDTLEIVFTSGTTATPKGVRITHGNVLTSLEPLEGEIAKYIKWERFFHPIRFLNLLPLSHVFGQFMGLFIPQLLTGLVVFHDSLGPAQIVETVKRRRISVLVAVPRILEALRTMLEREYEERGELDRLRAEIAASEGIGPAARLWRFRRVHRRFGWKFWAFISGGATLDAETELFWRRLGFGVVQGYGMTETASLVSVNHPFKMSHGSIGKVMPGREIRLDDATGEILVRGANISPGYWGGAGGAVDDEGWLHTGDIGEMDADGNLFFKGRKKDVIVTAAGVNVHPEDLEAALDAQPEVARSAVVGVAGAFGPEPAAAIILRDPAADPAAVVARATATLAEAQQIRRWIVWPDADFPRTPTHKVRRAAIAAAFGDGERPVAGEAGSPLGDLIAQAAGSPLAGLSPDAKLGADLKLDSLARVELLSAIEERYQLDIDEAAFTAATSVGDVQRLLREGAGAGPATPYPYPRWAQRWPVTWVRAAVFHLLTMPAARLMVGPAVRGRERLEGLEGPALFVANHIASADAGLVMYALPFRYRTSLAIAMEGEILRQYRYPPAGLGWLARARHRLQYVLVAALFNTFPLPQQSGFRRSFAFAGESVERGFSILVFPEGRRTPDGRMHRFRSGTGVLAGGLGLPVVPMRIDGLYELKVRRQRFAPAGSVRVTIGEPVTFPPGTEPEVIARDLERRVADLA
jgi:long-chain acyl-CoA synthetase